MTTAVINQLFEEGITRSRELSDAADEAMRAIDDMAKEAEELAQRVDTEAAEARQHIQELTSRLERSEGALGDGRPPGRGSAHGPGRQVGRAGDGSRRAARSRQEAAWPSWTRAARRSRRT